jgi:hypothetical protein
VHEFVLFVLDDVLYLLPKFSLRLWAYSAHLDPQCAGVCPVRFGLSAHVFRDCIPMIVCVSIRFVGRWHQRLKGAKSKSS